MRHPEGTIIKRGKTAYRARIRLRGTEYSQTFPTANEAEKWLFDLRLAADESDIAHKLHVEQLKVADILTRFRDEVAAKRASAESRRRELGRCKFMLEQQTQLSSMKAVALQPRHIARYVIERRTEGASNGSIRAELAIVRRAYTLAGGAWGLGLEQPVRKSLMPPPPPSRERRLSPDEYSRLMEAARQYENSIGGKDRIPIGAIIEWAINTAMRRNEIASLTWDRITIFEDGFGVAVLTALCTKSSKARETPIPPEVVQVILTLPSAATRTGSVFASSYGAIGTAWSRVLKLAGLYLSKKEIADLKRKNPRNDYGLRLHDLRHEGVSRFFEIFSLPKALVQSISGHSSEAMNDRYAHLEARPMVLRAMREAYAKLHPEKTLSADVGKPAPAPAIQASVASAPAAVLSVAKINPRWKTLKSNAAALREAVWAQPIADLADALGLSDVAIHKACAKLNVPKPPRGHWLKAGADEPSSPEPAAV